MEIKLKSPTLFDDCKSIDIASLKKWGYLHPDQIKSGKIIWSLNGHPTGDISIWVSTLQDQSFLELIYILNGKPIRYKVPLVNVPSN
jgi:hypothetical protein